MLDFHLKSTGIWCWADLPTSLSLLFALHLFFFSSSLVSTKKAQAFCSSPWHWYNHRKCAYWFLTLFSLCPFVVLAAAYRGAKPTTESRNIFNRIPSKYYDACIHALIQQLHWIATVCHIFFWMLEIVVNVVEKYVIRKVILVLEDKPVQWKSQWQRINRKAFFPLLQHSCMKAWWNSKVFAELYELIIKKDNFSEDE